ncbi:MAG: hypothetical protein JJV98_07890 [Desulfosarcina sp.]|nr:hypothetical protein [Desulfobacterales bacterium]
MIRFNRQLSYKSAPSRPQTFFLMAFLGLMMSMGLTRLAEAQDDLEIVRRAVLVPQAVGIALTGGKADTIPDRVGFSKRIRADAYLVRNGFRLARVNTSFYRADLLLGSLTFEDDLGRRVCKAYTINYVSKGKDRLIVRKAKMNNITPFIPAHEVYIVPAEKMSLKKMRTRAFTDLLTFARKHTIQVTQEALDPAPRNYQVLVFDMDRLHPKDGWNLFADETMGRSWGKNGWMVAGTTSSFAVNGPDEVIFRVFHARGRGSAVAGKTLAVGAFTNHYQPPIPAGPSPVVEVTPAMRELKTRYASKAFPNLNKE